MKADEIQKLIEEYQEKGIEDLSCYEYIKLRLKD